MIADITKAIQKVTKLVRTTLNRWFNDDPFTLSASVAYYAVFSLPGLMIMILAIGSMVFEQQAIEEAILGHITAMLGGKVADSVGSILRETRHEDRSFWAFIVGALTLAFGATGLFAQLQKALNVIWNVDFKNTRGIQKFLKNRLISFGMVVSLGFLLLISLVATAILTILNEWLSISLPFYFIYIIHLVDIFVSFLFCLLIFTLIYKVLPDTYVGWRSAITGGALAAVLFLLGEYGMSLYFETAEPQSTFGAAGSIILVMLWASYSCLLLLLGAQFAKTYGEYYNDKHGNISAEKPKRKKKT